MKVSVVLLTHNEAQNLPRCLASLAGIGTIVMVDSGSTDDTVAIAEAAGVHVLHRAFDTFAGQRNFALDQGPITDDWVLHLDADEELTLAFRAALDRLDPPAGIDGYQVPSKTMLQDQWLRHAGMYPTYQVRLGHATRLRFKQVGHGQREDVAPDRIAVFDEPYLHHNFSKGLTEWFTKHIRYARDEAAVRPATGNGTLRDFIARDRTLRRRALKRLVTGLPAAFRPVLRFFYIYLVRQGFRDGRAGLQYAMMMMAYEAMIASYMYENKSR